MLRTLLPLFFCFVLLAPSRADERVRAEIESTLGAMSKAVLAADQKGFLAHIDPEDKHFYTEQVHWSDELVHYRPAEFSLTIGTGEATFAESTAEFPLVMAWKFTDGPKDNWGTDPKGRTVAFPTVRFAKREGKWVYRGEKWKEVYSPDNTFIVRFLAGSEAVAEDVVKAFPAAKAHVDSEFQNEIKERQTLVLYRSMDHLKATVFLNMPDPVLGGWSEPGESIKFMDNYTRTVPSWTAAYAHEYGHVATWALGAGTRTMPWWVQEGVAELCAGKFRPGYAQRLDREMRQRAAAGTLADWNAISDYLAAEQRFKQLAYRQGDHMNQFVTQKWKREGRNAWLKAMGAGKSIEEASREALGVGFDELDRLWRESLKAEEKAEEKKEEPSAPEPAGVRESLVAFLKEMSAAIGEADQKKYLAMVSKADPVFFKEQENWAADLGRKKPEFIEVLLDEPPLRVDAQGAAIGRVTTNWRMPGKRDRSISFPAKFVKGEAGWMYAGEHWHVHKGEKSLVMYESEELKETAEAVAELLPEIRAHVEEGFGLAGDEHVTGAVQQVKLYTSMRHLQHSIYLSYSDGLSGWNEPGEAIKILANPGSRRTMLRVLLGHEYGHVATFHMGPKSNEMQWWILEGVAELSAAKFARSSSRVDRTVKLWAKTGKLIEWERLADFRGEAANHSMNVYTQGHHMVAYIEENYTRAKLNDWIRSMSKGTSLDQATREELGLTFAELDEKWREAVAPPPAERQ